MSDNRIPAEIAAIANTVLASQRWGGILRVSDYPVLSSLLPHEVYENGTWTAQRRRVDQLDQVTFGRKR